MDEKRHDMYKFKAFIQIERSRYEEENYIDIIQTAFDYCLNDSLISCTYNFSVAWICDEDGEVGTFEMFGKVYAYWSNGSEIDIASMLENMPLEEYVLGIEAIAYRLNIEIVEPKILQTLEGYVGPDKEEVAQPMALNLKSIKKTVQKGKILFSDKHQKALNSQKKHIDGWAKTFSDFSDNDKQTVISNNLFLALKSQDKTTRMVANQIVQDTFPVLLAKIKQKQLLTTQQIQTLLEKNVALSTKYSLLVFVLQADEIKVRFDKLAFEEPELQRIHWHHKQHAAQTTKDLYDKFNKKLMLEDVTFDNVNLHIFNREMSTQTLALAGLENKSTLKDTLYINRNLLNDTNQKVADYLGKKVDPGVFTLVVDQRLLQNIECRNFENAAALYDFPSKSIFYGHWQVGQAKRLTKQKKLEPILVHELIHHYQKRLVALEGNYPVLNKLMEGETELTARECSSFYNSPLNKNAYTSFVFSLKHMLETSLSEAEAKRLCKSLHGLGARDKMGVLSTAIFGKNTKESRQMVLATFQNSLEHIEKHLEQNNAKIEDEKLQQFVIGEILSGFQKLYPLQKSQTSLAA